MGGSGKTRVPPASPASFCYNKPLTIKEKVLQDFSPLILSNKGADRNPDDEILSAASCLVFTFAVSPFGGTKLFGVG
jgi:hypothetical protein